jgi:hypothetical protein
MTAFRADRALDLEQQNKKEFDDGACSRPWNGRRCREAN